MDNYYWLHIGFVLGVLTGGVMGIKSAIILTLLFGGLMIIRRFLFDLKKTKPIQEKK